MKNQKGIIHLFVIIILALAVVGGIGYYAYKNGQIRLTPPQEFTSQPTPLLESTANWKTYRDKAYGFEFKFPENLNQDFADGPAGSSTNFYNSQFILSVTANPPATNASDFVQNILDRKPGYPNCDLFPTCDEHTFQVKKKLLANNVYADIVSGPSTEEDKIDEIYFIDNRNNQTVQLWFTFEDKEEPKTLKNQILSTFQFLD
ncbi:hypothetical protein A2962_02795 [Candidatus Woesebacteria bacterium RIFCSPLOWO2_01_FULL_39_61]|uniref:Uncharacterized protein n=1 Tax=Candidatus Woesebacteria bacterium RIFCSPHIGHO2_02_FULL_39_13 TaxID=1802505 RepID=A0A1F7Z1W3_9BACT|nr:MAG: hypothetical protein A2692_04935 [Candidatus Woesebacteria bacterium RIFCSPHIGHO2_01_FULL_39_95]OGM33552.1 MAG: hypothetical protein A3D01_01195 [Candidatus Woesebacteria bacterium RIFCSPHIGHO2_02_FULL_39_13]OGM38630.1 MAG: hypothetical protein A3E13_04615 [Candidatus Woesebacteria bacterium RIFCSPHIGHO2_12_FULL_40_20]OGM67321.1 MAG: hypothetical protein A2962_02795 [Candidatus Woesebacteria bacterium RIFCSPLOWO2_01_FULL_39_61]OGM71691.1 MAG: hypothetical protein A3H19_01585 [Candidatus